jgi:hypothetical protein
MKRSQSPNDLAQAQPVAAYSKLNANGQWIDRRETIDLNDLFLRMTEDEMQRYVATGELPEWFSSLVGATTGNSRGGGNER